MDRFHRSLIVKVPRAGPPDGTEKGFFPMEVGMGARAACPLSLPSHTLTLGLQLELLRYDVILSRSRFRPTEGLSTSLLRMYECTLSRLFHSGAAAAAAGFWRTIKAICHASQAPFFIFLVSHSTHILLLVAR